ncbi:MerR family transcriptional regulator [Lacticaseibacillus nasuensis]|uniref:HTH merR-type domain-containing protein n=1 Tax=Lacticaseibacillus nasuensis JCM 17158 TaxID=1291734 RepID=A0A0R1JGU3_9LACO|nr:MerR family transcriptional regulator [Lacticaseibacillus nasuensis]KRK70502.1 hypothetical protein FD02_GL000572 [Lacticaseibacillus nasuensis JCM 17158]
MSFYSMQTIATKYDLAPSTLRYYEQIGLLRHVPRQSTHRVYTQAHDDRLAAITCFKQTGMSLDEIKAFFQYEDEGGDLDAVVALLESHEANLEAHIAELKQNQVHIRRKVQFYRDIAAAAAAGKPAPDWANYPLSNFTDEALAHRHSN